MWLGVFSLALLIQVSYGVILVVRLLIHGSFGKERMVLSGLAPISIIIAAKNEAENLLKNIPAFLNLKYPEFEVVVVLNNTVDGSEKILRELQSTYSNLIVCVLPENQQGKKAALAYGIESAKNDNLVFSDADCIPFTDTWLLHFGEAFANGGDLVLGTGMFDAENTLVNKLYRLEAERIAQRYTLAAMFNAPYMGVGRSMGYTKALYKTVDGYSGHTEIASGDDDLFVQSIPFAAKTIAIPEAVTSSKAPDSIASWFSQKRRHLQTGSRYKLVHLILLGLLDASDLIIVLGVLFSLIYSSADMFATLLSMTFFVYVLKVLALWGFEAITGRKSGVWIYFFLEPILSLLNPLFSIASQFGQPKEWTRKI